MLRRSTKIQLILFVVITLLGVSYVSAEYVGLTQDILGDGCTVSADFTNSGGIFTNAEVTYRGVTVGKVGTLHLIGKSTDLPSGGVRVDLDLDSCSSPRIPADVTANIHNRSVVGEQYVDLVPAGGATAQSPAIVANAVLPADRNTTPVPTQDILLHLQQLIQSVPLGDLRTTVDELGKAFAGRGGDLQTLLDATNRLLADANSPENLSATLSLIQDSNTVLQTQLDESSAIDNWTTNLNLLSQQLRSSDPDIRRILDNGPGDLMTVNNFIQDNQSGIAVTLANLANLGDVLVAHLPGVEQVLELYPALAAGGQSFLRDDGTSGKRIGYLGLVLQSDPNGTPPDCGNPYHGQQGYAGTVRRTPDQLQPIAPNVAVRCTADPTNSTSLNTNIRGSAYVPGGDPISISGGGYAYPRVSTANTTASSAVGSTVAIGPGAGAAAVPNRNGQYLTMLVSSLG